MCKGFGCCLLKYTCRQICLFTIGISNGISVGAVFAFSAVLFFQLENDNSFVLNEKQSHMIEHIPLVLMIPAALFSGTIVEKIGRKATLLLLDVVAFISWLLVFLGENYGMIIVARCLIGIYVGAFYPTFITFIGEVTTPKYRSVLLTAIPLGSTHGFFACATVQSLVNFSIGKSSQPYLHFVHYTTLPYYYTLRNRM